MNPRIHIIYLFFLLIQTLSSQVAAQHTAYRTVKVEQGGVIEGWVKLKDSTPSPHILEVQKDLSHCGSTILSPKLTFGPDNGIKNAVIRIDNIASGKYLDREVTFVLDQKGCEFDPHILLLPAGAKLEIVNSDAVLHNVHAQRVTDNFRTLFNIAQPVQGQRTAIREALVSEPGLIKAVCDAGHPWMSAYIMIINHPYYTVTDENGYFMLEDVPPGTYTVTMWHAGVHITETYTQGDMVTKYEYEPPYEVSRTVSVSPDGTARIEFELALR